jgi:hypothetical protein
VTVPYEETETESQVATLPDGMYQISLPPENLLSALDLKPGAPLRLLHPDPDVRQQWQVHRTSNDTYTIRESTTGLYVNFEGDPDPNEPARGHPEPREWQLTAGEAPETFLISVPGTELRLAQSPLRIFPPFVALAPPFMPEYQTWTFRSVA